MDCLGRYPYGVASDFYGKRGKEKKGKGKKEREGGKGRGKDYFLF